LGNKYTLCHLLPALLLLLAAMPLRAHVPEAVHDGTIPVSDTVATAQADGPRCGRVGWEVKLHPAYTLSLDSYSRKWLRKRGTFSMAAEASIATLPQDSDSYAADYGYPLFGIGLRYSLNHGTTMRKDADDAWPYAPISDVATPLGNSVTAYGTFRRTLIHHRTWQWDYSFNIGLGWSHRKYHPVSDSDNELIGSRWLIFFGVGTHVSWQISPLWAVYGGLELCHHSNGNLNKPNKGANAFGPVVGLRYTPYEETLYKGRLSLRRDTTFRRYWYGEITVGAGGKTLSEDWNLTQYQTLPGEDRFRTDRFKVYPVYTLETNVMYRHARRWATGLGLDFFYGTYYKRLREIEDLQGYTEYHHSPFALGIAARHEVFWHNLSLSMCVGVYVKRNFGVNADEVEAPVYDRIGLKYHFRRLGGLTLGANVTANLLRANFTEVTLGFPVRW